MQIKTTLLLLACLLLCGHITKAQLVIDADSKEPVPFATVISVDNPDIGTSTDLDGSFHLDLEDDSKIRVSSIGYKTAEFSYSGENMVIEISSIMTELEGVVITSNEDIEAKILKKCIENRSLNAPKKRDFFQCTLYNKYKVEMLKDSVANNNKLQRLLEKNITGTTLFFSESAIAYAYQNPGKVEERIIANNVAGFEKAQFNVLPEQLVPFDIQTDFLTLLSRHYLLPISEGSRRHYGLHLAETKIDGTDTTWMIQFWPEKSNYDLLRGHVIIHSDGYAIQEYRLTNKKKDSQKFDIYHHFKRVNGTWFPDKMFSNVIMKEPTLNIILLYDQKTYLSDVTFDQKEIKTADANRVTFDEGVQDNPEWIEKHRVEELSTADEVAITEISTTIEDLNIERKVDIIANLTFGRFPLGLVDVDMTRLIGYNEFEGYRPGFGLITSDKLSKRFTLNAFGGYGLSDKEWKYGAGFTYHFNEQKTASAYINFEREVQQISSYVAFSTTAGFISNFYSSQIEDYTAYKTGFKGRLKNWDFDLSFNKSKNNPRYKYVFLKEPEIALTEFRHSEFNLNINFLKRKFIPFYTYEVVIEDFTSTFFDLDITYAPEGLFESNVSYFKVDAFAKRPINFKHLGRMEIAIQTGFILGDQVLNRSHIGNGSNADGIPYQLPYSFNTMPPFNFMANRYVNFFYDHRLFRLFSSRYSAPYIHLAQTSGWGEASNRDQHRFIPLQDYQHGYHETGIILESLLRYEAFSVMSLGLNLGIWQRWGHYASGNSKDDLVFKIGFGANF